MSWEGTYKLIQQQNAATFFKSLGLPDAEVKRLEALKLETVITRNGDEFCIKQKSGDAAADIRFTLGKTTKYKSVEGMDMEGVVTAEGDTVLVGNYNGGVVERVVLKSDGTIEDKFSKGGVSMTRIHSRS